MQGILLTLVGASVMAAAESGPAATGRELRDTESDTWVAEDALGRRLPGFDEVGAPRPDRTVGIFYFLWLGAHEQNGPTDISRVLRQDPTAIGKTDSPLWGPLHAMHHWGEPLFGYYRADDRYVLRKHAQMLSDAGVDMVVFDVTNQATYRDYYLALLDEWGKVREQGGRTPQVAFLCPFWAPQKVVPELYRDLYQPAVHPELWFRWDGKPLILADPDQLSSPPDLDRTDQPAVLVPGHTLGQTLTLAAPFTAVSGRFPTWQTTDAAVTLTLYRGGPGGEKLASQRFANVADNGWLELPCPTPQPPGVYYLEASDPQGRIGWWSTPEERLPGGQAYADGSPVAGDRSVGHRAVDSPLAEILAFFTFRTPQPDYFRGPTGPDMWSWLEVHPQHVFRNRRGEKEQMGVGVAQNAVGNRLGSMSEPGARGRSFTAAQGDRSGEPGAVNQGWNLQEQFARALTEDPRLIFVTGWNEWIAQRFTEFAGVKQPVVFVDQFDQEHSRDIEPMRGGHGDAYYCLLTALVRRYKGVRPPPAASPPQTIGLGGAWSQWDEVRPEYRDDLGDPARRDHPGYNHHTQYRNDTGRNDLARFKVAADATHLFLYAETRDPLTPADGPHWMELFLNTDGRRDTGWEGYDFVVNRVVRSPTVTTLHRWDGTAWVLVADLPLRIDGHRLMLAIPRASLGLGPATRLDLQFKWADNLQADDVAEFYLNGDVAPNGRATYRYRP